MNEKIDIVISWLNPNDAHWQQEFAKARLKYKGDSSSNRINDYSTFKYFLRSVETNLKFINKVFLVLNDEHQIPSWLNVHCDKLKIVFLKDFMPSFLLPQFNTFAIEAFYHFIPELSETFIFCNDDMIFTKALSPEFFFRNGKPVDFGTKSRFISCNPVDARNCNKFRRSNTTLFGRMTKNTLMYAKNSINKDIEFYENTHMPCPFSKSSWNRWLNLKDLCRIFKDSKFREEKHISTILLMRWIRLHFNEYVEDRTLINNYQYLEIHGNDINEYKTIMNGIRDGKILCINDMILPKYFADVKIKIEKILSVVFPEKSNFET